MRPVSRPPGHARAALLGVLPLLLLAPGAWAGDAKAGRKAAVACQTCHGLDGVSKLPEAPNLSGQVEPYLVKALTEYRDGTRRNAIMNVVAKPLSDAEIADLAAYYAAIQVDGLPPG